MTRNNQLAAGIADALKPVRSNVGKLADELGELKSAIADLERQAELVRRELIDLGPGYYEGAVFRAAVTHSERQTLDLAAVRAKLSPQFIAAHTRTSDVWSVRVNAR